MNRNRRNNRRRDGGASSDRYAHITGDYYMDREKYPAWAWISAVLLCFLLPPAGVFLVSFYFGSSLTTKPQFQNNRGVVHQQNRGRNRRQQQW